MTNSILILVPIKTKPSINARKLKKKIVYFTKIALSGNLKSNGLSVAIFSFSRSIDDLWSPLK